MPDTRPSLDAPTPSKSSVVRKLLGLGLVLFGAGVLFWLMRGVLSLQYLASQEAQLRAWQTDAPILAATVAVFVYVTVTGLSLPGAAVLTLVCGWYFGFWQGLLIVSFGSTGGAMVAFLISRYFLRDWIQSQMQDRLGRINDAFDREGAFYLFTLRLVPAVPFFVINVVMGLTKIRATTFWWVSQLGMLPGTAAYVYAGSTVPSLQSLADQGAGSILSGQMILAFAILGILPLAIKKIMALVGRKQQDSDPHSNDEYLHTNGS
ncbi:TVP38/TMEM64 family protein [Aureliella helgolandensis]|uniref:TVP38/TMEM64 family membrane protein n=1 Tax=Aureliella helgolandensis TaxID=2527968 RepID=A0A518GAA6_9BACT|nr:TVP38/TMEM64 family protein [Aureliella helgolandensis]QDV25521.1 TVP38/TMEM64 family inner membrane protein YdjZ [Aureliella helgolandensis]